MLFCYTGPQQAQCDNRMMFNPQTIVATKIVLTFWLGSQHSSQLAHVMHHLQIGVMMLTWVKYGAR